MGAPIARRGRAVALVVLTLVLLVLVGLVPVGSAAGAERAHPAAAVAGPTDPSASFASRAGYASDRSTLVADATPATGSRLVVVTFHPRDPSFFQTPPTDAPPLTSAEIADRFGLTLSQYTAVAQYFLGQGLRVVHPWPDRMSLTLTGPAGAIDRAFGTTIVEGTLQGRTVSFPSTAPTLPAPIEGMVESVTGLSSGFDSFALPLLHSSATGPASGAPSQSNNDLVTPAIARQIYRLSDLYNRSGGSPPYATSQGIAVILWGPGYVPSDLTTFYQRYYPATFPQPTIVPQPIDGAPAPSASAGNDPCGAAEELTLDLEWSGSMAPGATLYAVYAPEGSPTGCSPSVSAMSDALHAAIGLPVHAISMSFGSAESSDLSLRATWDTYLQEAELRGITPLAATGDTGGDASVGCGGGPSLQYPSSSPDVVAVGGTAVTLSRNLLGQVTGFAETAWNDSGGGFSAQFPAPWWQQLGNSARGEPDISATASDNFLYYDGQPQAAGGTSFSTPLWAGLIAEITAQYGRSMAPIAPRLYSIGAEEPSGRIGVGLADVTSGSTCLGSAGPGWDPETGWGSPRALLLYEDLTATFVALSMTVSPTSTGPGGSVTISAHLSNATSGAPISGVAVDLSLASSTNLGPCTGTFASASPTSGPSGNVSATMSVPACYLGASATARATVQTNGLYGTNSTTVPVNLLAFVPFLSGVTTFPYNVLGFGGIFVAAGLIGYVLGRPRRRSSPPARYLTLSSGGQSDPALSGPAPTPSSPTPPASALSPVAAAGSTLSGPPPPGAPAPSPEPSETAAEAPKTT